MITGLSLILVIICSEQTVSVPWHGHVSYRKVITPIDKTFIWHILWHISKGTFGYRGLKVFKNFRNFLHFFAHLQLIFWNWFPLENGPVNFQTESLSHSKDVPCKRTVAIFSIDTNQYTHRLSVGGGAIDFIIISAKRI